MTISTPFTRKFFVLHKFIFSSMNPFIHLSLLEDKDSGPETCYLTLTIISLVSLLSVHFDSMGLTDNKNPFGLIPQLNSILGKKRFMSLSTF